ncbi:MAG TPA: inositol monophosphatase family protein [Candidatus Krumholzibacteria bacterium]|nr:inositol monophosphatase family protein [Candidatus Krumholzibacteria bacterium]
MSAQPPASPRAATWLELLHEICDSADGIAMRHFRRADLRVDDKHDGSPVSEADRAIEAMARELVAKRAPGIGVFGEEEGETRAQNGARLIIDPIDGTRNFVRGIPVFASLLAIEEEGVLTAGMVSAPAMRMRWYAARGLGAFLGPRRLHVSSIGDLAGAHLFHGDLSGRVEGRQPQALGSLFSRVERTRGFGDFYQHMLVAEGCGEIALDAKMQPWDVAAVKIIVEEAGGKSTSYSGEDSISAPNLVSSNGHLHAAVLAMIGG